MDKNNQDEVDLSGMLSGYGKKVEQFQNWQQWQVNPNSFAKSPRMIQWIIKYSGGLIRNERQANYILLGFVAIVIVISLILLLRIGLTDNLEDIKVLPA